MQMVLSSVLTYYDQAMEFRNGCQLLRPNGNPSASNGNRVNTTDTFERLSKLSKNRFQQFWR